MFHSVTKVASALATTLLVMFIATSARAVDLGEGLSVIRTGNEFGVQVFATQGGVQVELMPSDVSLRDDVDGAWFKVSPDKQWVTVTFNSNNCGNKQTMRYARAELLALVAQRRGLDLVKAGSPAAAVPFFEQAVAGQPEDGGMRVNLAQTLVAAGRADDAATVLAATPHRAQLVVTWLVRNDPTIAHIADTPALRAWRVGTKPLTLPVWDPTRRLLVVADWTGNSMAETSGSRGITVLDADTGAPIFGADGDKLALLAAELGFEEPIERRATSAYENVRFETGGVTVVGDQGKLYVRRQLVSGPPRPVRALTDGERMNEAALFEDRVLVTGFYSEGDGCGAMTGASFTLIPITRPPNELAMLASVNRARRDLSAGKTEAALALTGDAPVVKAWRAIAQARAGRLAEARATLATLPELWALAAATHALAPAALRDGLPAPTGDATSLPAWDPKRRVLATPHPLVADAADFFDGEATKADATTLRGIDLSPGFFARRGFMRPLAMTKAHDASAGGWRAAFSGPPDLRVSCSDTTLVFARDGVQVAGSRCAARYPPTDVWFFRDAVVYRSAEEPIGNDEHGLGLPVVRHLVAAP